MAIQTYTAGKAVGDFVKNLHSKVMNKVKYGIGSPETRTVTRWQFPGRGAHAGQVLTVKPNGNKNIRTLETAFAGYRSDAEFQPYLRETISEDVFTKEKIADIMYSSSEGIVERIVGSTDNPDIRQFISKILTGNPQAKSLILNRY